MIVNIEWDHKRDGVESLSELLNLLDGSPGVEIKINSKTRVVYNPNWFGSTTSTNLGGVWEGNLTKNE